MKCKTIICTLLLFLILTSSAIAGKAFGLLRVHAKDGTIVNLNVAEWLNNYNDTYNVFYGSLENISLTRRRPHNVIENISYYSGNFVFRSHGYAMVTNGTGQLENHSITISIFVPFRPQKSSGEFNCFSFTEDRIYCNSTAKVSVTDVNASLICFIDDEYYKINPDYCFNNVSKKFQVNTFRFDIFKSGGKRYVNLAGGIVWDDVIRVSDMEVTNFRWKS
jgi:hypothetical protein